MEYNIIMAAGREGLIGYKNTIPWHFKEDLQFFKEQTMGSYVVMGRKTWDSIPFKFRPLPGRQNVVVSKTMYANDNPGVLIVPHLDLLQSAIESHEEFQAKKRDSVYIIGGASLYDWAFANLKIRHFYFTCMFGNYVGDTFVKDFQMPEKFDEEILYKCDDYVRVKWTFQE